MPALLTIARRTEIQECILGSAVGFWFPGQHVLLAPSDFNCLTQETQKNRPQAKLRQMQAKALHLVI